MMILPTKFARHRQTYRLLPLAIAWSVGVSMLAGPPETLEYQVKAAFLYNFAKFVEWPLPALGPPGSPIVVAVLGKDPFGSQLEQTFGNKTVQGRTIVVRRGEKLDDVKGCHILFVSSSEKRHLQQIFEALKKSSVLTVGEVDHFAELGGMINFVLENDKVHFEINVGSAERSGLKISSQLLRLAKVVKAAQPLGGD